MSVRPRALDLFCGAGGVSVGLWNAGFRVEGCDKKPQPNYPFRFTLGNALDADFSKFDFVWASPPCQAHSNFKHLNKHNKEKHVDLIPETRAKLKAWGGLILSKTWWAPHWKTHSCFAALTLVCVSNAIAYLSPICF